MEKIIGNAPYVLQKYINTRAIEGEVYLLELNIRRPGVYYCESWVAKRAICSAKYLAEQNK